jgi:hypothetical protein
MPKTLWSPSAPKVEVDQRSRETRLRVERVERLLVPRARPTRSWLRQVVFRLQRRRRPSQAHPASGRMLPRGGGSIATRSREYRVRRWISGTGYGNWGSNNTS